MSAYMPGEYDTVGRRSTVPTLLQQAHLTPCTQAQSTALLAELFRRYSLSVRQAGIRFAMRGRPDAEVEHAANTLPASAMPTNYELHFGWSTRGRGGWRLRLTRAWLSLPAASLSEETLTPDCAPGLRVGLVLHEFAHVLTPWAKHGSPFIQTLDRLVRETIDLWASWPHLERPRLQTTVVWKTAAGAPAPTTTTPYDLALRTAQAHYNFKAKVERTNPAIAVGMTVSWTSPKHGGAFTGVVLTNYAGCRARVKTDDGREFYVPQMWLTEVK